MQFRVRGELIQLQGDASLSKTQVSMKTMMKAFKGDTECCWNWGVWELK